MKKTYFASFAYTREKMLGWSFDDGEFEIEGPGLDIAKLKEAISANLHLQPSRLGKIESLALLFFKRRN